MAGAAENPQEAGSGERPPHDAPDAVPAKADPALLERVLQQTATAADAARVTSNAEILRLRAVANRRKELPLTLEPVVVEMVQAVLGNEFAGIENDPVRFRAMTVEIARALMDDPAAQQRLEAMWTKLREQDR